MRPFPMTTDTPVVRTDFSDEAAWETIGRAIRETEGEFEANVTFVDDRAYEGAGPEQVEDRVPTDWGHTFLFLVDRVAIAHP